MGKLADWLYSRALRVARSRSPDFVVGDAERPYLYRWWLIPRNPWFNAYLHQFLRDDDDRALHDHPWVWCSILIHGGYVEHTIAAGGVHRRRLRRALSVKVSGPWRAHRVELLPHGGAQHFPLPAWTIFITGPRLREWGFHCPSGWVHWRRFTVPDNPGATGRGCGED